MKNLKETKKTTENPLEKLKSFLDEEFKPKPEEIKPPKMDWNDMENFFNEKVKPVFKKLEKQLSEYNFQNLTIEVHTRLAKLKINESLNHFHFKLDIDNGGRQIKIFYSLKYRLHTKKKLIDIPKSVLENHTISFNDIDTINDELILSLFAKWYTSKNETIQKSKEWLANKEQEDN